jgi:hypothetical protein
MTAAIQFTESAILDFDSVRHESDHVLGKMNGGYACDGRKDPRRIMIVTSGAAGGTLLPKVTAVSSCPVGGAEDRQRQITVADRYPAYPQTPMRGEFTTGRNDSSPHS